MPNLSGFLTKLSQAS